MWGSSIMMQVTAKASGLNKHTSTIPWEVMENWCRCLQYFVALWSNAKPPTLDQVVDSAHGHDCCYL